MLAGYSPWSCKESDMTYRMCMLAKLLQSCPTLSNPCMGFSRQKHWSGLPCPSPGDLPYPKIKPVSLKSPALAGGFFTTRTTWESPRHNLATKHTNKQKKDRKWPKAMHLRLYLSEPPLQQRTRDGTNSKIRLGGGRGIPLTLGMESLSEG